MKPEWEIVDVKCSLLAGSSLSIDNVTTDAVGSDEALTPELDELLFIQ